MADDDKLGIVNEEMRKGKAEAARLSERLSWDEKTELPDTVRSEIQKGKKEAARQQDIRSGMQDTGSIQPANPPPPPPLVPYSDSDDEEDSQPTPQERVQQRSRGRRNERRGRLGMSELPDSFEFSGEETTTNQGAHDSSPSATGQASGDTNATMEKRLDEMKETIDEIKDIVETLRDTPAPMTLG